MLWFHSVVDLPPLLLSAAAAFQGSSVYLELSNTHYCIKEGANYSW